MKQRQLFYSTGCGVAGLLVLCASVLAAPEAKPQGKAPPSAHPHHSGAMREGDQGKRDETGRRDGKQDAGVTAHHPPSGSAGPARSGPRIERDPAERKERHKQRVKELRGRWGAHTLKQPAVQQELQHHAWREARLKRLRELAMEKKNDKLLAKLDELEKKEQVRHERAMARHQQGGAAPVGSGVPAPSAASAAAAQGGQP